MDIFYLGHSSFKLKGKHGSIITDPFDSKKVGLKYSSNEADIVSISHEHEDHNAVSAIKGEPKVISGPGEYEIKGISILGFSSFHDSKNGEERGKNTIYVFEIDTVRICHLGDLGQKLSDSLIESLGDIDVLMIPVGGIYTIDPTEAVEIVRDMEPSFILPMHYYVDGMEKETFGKLEPVETFLKEVALTVEKMPKLTIKKEEVDLEVQKVILLEKK
ncbi:MBL fold metallo-hydrolase [Patescibacteria group bacterium]|nr:MBL fold metallo-hydrolase [Patescibacteria group bacterium]MBU2036380.1 MBL fold metallo-hydrolase [Patescibacteria group bacterium]